MGDVGYQHRRQRRREEAPRSEHHEIGIGDGGDDLRKGGGGFRPDRHRRDGARPLANATLTDHRAAVQFRHHQLDRDGRHRIDRTREVEHGVDGAQGVAEVALHLGEGGDEQVAEGVPLELRATTEPVLE